MSKMQAEQIELIVEILQVIHIQGAKGAINTDIAMQGVFAFIELVANEQNQTSESGLVGEVPIETNSGGIPGFEG